MAINIKELFVTDLDPGSTAWWSKDKVDKINYNFNQLLNGGTPGPQGTIGVDGGTGPIGALGYNGYKGPQGYQGYQGVGSLNDWDYFPEAGGLPGYLFPRKNPINISQSAPVALRIGFLSADTTFYGVGADPITSPTQIVKTNPFDSGDDWINLRVEDINNINGYNFSFGNSGASKFEISPDITSSKFYTIYVAKNIILKTGNSNTTLNDAITITDNLITIDTGIIYNRPPFNLGNGSTTKSKDTLRFTTGADIDKILVSTDTNGNVEWKDVKEVFGTFPVGSIISIRPDEFISANFWLNDSINVNIGSPLNNIYGRGKVGTDYEGWYLCNGETWETVLGFNQTLTPNLNNFSYTITGNGDAQNQFIVSESNPILIGGYDMKISAVPDAAGLYVIRYLTSFPDNDTSPGDSTIFMGTSGIYETSRMIHIVYLERADLKWSHTGAYVPPAPAAGTIMLTEPALTFNTSMCSLPVTTNYSWTGNNDWNTFAIPSTYKLFNYGTTTYAPNGYYINTDGYPIRWRASDGTFTSRETACALTVPNNQNANFITSLIVDDANINGTVSVISNNIPQSGLYLDYNTTSFSTATTLKWSDDQTIHTVGSNAPQGWYRNLTSGVRRYWSGSAFVGVSFSEDWVHRVVSDSAVNPGYTSAVHGIVLPGGGYDSVCDLLQGNHLTYIAGNTAFSITTGYVAENVKNYESALYVTINWVVPLTNIDGEPQTTPPLINIKNQSKPGSTTYYTKFLNDYYDWGTIVSTTGKIGSVSAC